MRRVRILSAFLLVVFMSDGSARPGRAFAAQPREGAVLARARASGNEFVALWRYYWEVSSWYRFSNEGMTRAKAVWPPPVGEPVATLTAADSAATLRTWMAPGAPGDVQASVPQVINYRSVLTSCFRVMAYGSVVVRDLPRYMITSRARDRAVCPSWYLGIEAPPWDERLDVDGAILPAFRTRVVAARAALIAELDSAAGLLPADDWLAGQRVRFAIDQADSGSAARATGACRGTPWWCSALEGYRLASRHEVRRADSAFAVMLRQMPLSTRCTWNDLAILLDAAGRDAYDAIPCVNRDSINSRIWWLADPMYTEPGNERRVEHYARRVLVVLRGALDEQERWDMNSGEGGDAVAEMLIRYGWPSYSAWGSSTGDYLLYRNLGVSDSAIMRQHPFTTTEYGAPRNHTIPSWAAIRAPTRAEESEWELSVPASRIRLPLALDSMWWPVEHYGRRGRALVRPHPQVGMFRRQDQVLLAIGVDVYPEDFGRTTGDTLHGAVAFSPAPEQVGGSTRTQVVVGFTNSIVVPVMSRPQIVSLELSEDNRSRTPARARFGVEPPQPLSALAPGEIAIVAPVAVRVPGPREMPETDAARALLRMHGLAIRGPLVGFYWETYGVREGDTVDVALRFDPKVDPPGFLRRLGQRLGIVGEPYRGLSFEWREPDPGHSTTTTAGPVPIQGRNITLDLSQLKPAEYTLTVSVARLGGMPAVATRPFTILP